MRITSQEAEQLRVRLKDLDCKAENGRTKWEVIIKDANDMVVALIESVNNDLDNLILTTYNSKSITWEMTPSITPQNTSKLQKAIDAKKKMMESKTKMDQWTVQYELDRQSWQNCVDVLSKDDLELLQAKDL